MITTAEAFDKFKSRLEPGEREERDAISRRERVKEILEDAFHLDRVIITGSYKRWTKVKPLTDVDLFCILNVDEESKYLSKSSRVLLDAFGKELTAEYGDANVRIWDKCVTVNFGSPTPEDDSRVFSIDVVPAFQDGKAYKIPDAYRSTGWMKTDPEIHAEIATKANKALDGHWVSLVKMAKKCNAHHGKPILPSFLVEVMAMRLIVPPFSGGYKYEMRSFIASIEQQIGNVWHDPAKLGSTVSEQMTPEKVTHARSVFSKIGRSIDKALLAERQGRVGDALSIWREEVFGPMFPLS